MRITDAGREEFLGVLERDYQTAQRLMEGANGSVDRTRTFGFTLVAALIGFTFTDHILWLGLLAAAATFIVAYVDSYHCWEYKTAFKHAQRIERIDQLRYKAHLGKLNDRDMSSLEVRVGSFLPGVLSGSGHFKVYRELWYSLPRSLLVLYALLTLTGVGAGIYAESNAAHRERPLNIHVTASEPKIIDPTAAVLAVLSRGQREQLAKLAALLRRSHSSQDRTLAAQIAQLLEGTAGALGAIDSLTETSGAAAEKAIGIVLDALSRAAAANLTYAPSTNINGPRFYFGGFALTLNAVKSGALSSCKPLSHCAKWCPRCTAGKHRSKWPHVLPLTP
jgi:hypothetical protein